jgi:hypothetical protein
MSKSKFSDLDAKVKTARSLQSQVDFITKVPLYPNAAAAVINSHAKFYGLRSKYDGRGNLRTPLTAATYDHA